MYPSPSEYVISLDEPLPDVTTITLVNTVVPLPAYEVNTNNNTLVLRMDGGSGGGTTASVTLDPGDYAPSDLASHVSAKLNNNPVIMQSFSVTYRPVTGTFIFESSDPFTLMFDGGVAPYGPQVRDQLTGAVIGQSTLKYRPCTPARLMGFGPCDYVSTHTQDEQSQRHVVIGPYRMDPSESKMAILFVGGADINNSINSSLLNRSFMIMGPIGSRLVNHVPTDLAIVKSYNPPQRVTKIHVRFLNVHGSLYDFQNQDHRLEFVVAMAPVGQPRAKWTERPYT